MDSLVDVLLYISVGCLLAHVTLKTWLLSKQAALQVEAPAEVQDKYKDL